MIKQVLLTLSLLMLVGATVAPVTAMADDNSTSLSAPAAGPSGGIASNDPTTDSAAANNSGDDDSMASNDSDSDSDSISSDAPANNGGQ